MTLEGNHQVGNCFFSEEFGDSVLILIPWVQSSWRFFLGITSEGDSSVIAA